MPSTRAPHRRRSVARPSAPFSDAAALATLLDRAAQLARRASPPASPRPPPHRCGVARSSRHRARHRRRRGRCASRGEGRPARVGAAPPSQTVASERVGPERGGVCVDSCRRPSRRVRISSTNSGRRPRSRCARRRRRAPAGRPPPPASPQPAAPVTGLPGFTGESQGLTSETTRRLGREFAAMYRQLVRAAVLHRVRSSGARGGRRRGRR